MTGARSMWTVGAALAALVLAAGSWLLLLSPELERASALDSQSEIAEDRNAMLTAEVASLSAGFARLGEYQAEIAQIRTQLPQTVELAELTRELGRMVEDSGATVRSVQVGLPVALTEVDELTADADPAGSATAAAPAGLYSVSVSLTVQGTTDQVKDYVDRLQSPDGRLLLMSRFSVGVDDEGVATVTISGHTYVLADLSTGTATEDAS